MEKEKSTAKSLATAGAATAFCGVVLYAVGRTLNFLFRDVAQNADDQNQTQEEADDEKEEL